MQQVQLTRMPRRRSSRITASSSQPTGIFTLMFAVVAEVAHEVLGLA